MASKIGPFEYVKAINRGADFELFNDFGGEGYSQFLINRTFSYYLDTLDCAMELTQRSNIPDSVHYKYYLNAVEPKYRFAPWEKATKNEDVELLCAYYECSVKRALEILLLISDSELSHIREKSFKGGRK